MKIISNVRGNRVVEWSAIEVRQRDYIESLLDQGFGFDTCFRYAQLRFGPIGGAFRKWVTG